MSDTEAVIDPGETYSQGFVRVESSEVAPAVWQPGWLPDGEFFPELTEARETYLRVRDAWQAAGARRQELERLIEADEVQRKQALRDAYLAGEANPQLAPPDAKLVAELAAVREQSKAAAKAYVESINMAIAVVLEHAQEWRGEIAAFEASVDDQVQALLREADALRAKSGRYWRLQHWIDRTVSGAQTPYDHFPYSDILAPLTGDPAEEAQRDQATFERSYAGSPTPERRATEQEEEALIAGNVASQRQPPQEADEVELSFLDEDDLVDWLMACGMFDSHTKPSPSLVVKAAEGDPDMAARLLQAERRANPEAVRPELIQALTEITNGKAATA